MEGYEKAPISETFAFVPNLERAKINAFCKEICLLYLWETCPLEWNKDGSKHVELLQGRYYLIQTRSFVMKVGAKAISKTRDVRLPRNLSNWFRVEWKHVRFPASTRSSRTNLEKSLIWARTVAFLGPRRWF